MSIRKASACKSWRVSSHCRKGFFLLRRPAPARKRKTATLKTDVSDVIELKRLLDQPDGQVDLGRAALLLARIAYPDLDLDTELAQLDLLAEQAAARVQSQPDAVGRVGALRSFLAGDCGFQGNEQDYYDPKNSFLNCVIESRMGIPITLCVVYIEIGRRLGLPLYGVGLPGHFLVKYEDPFQALLLDPFNSGRTVTYADCRELVERVYQGHIEFHDHFLAPVDKKYIVQRMLNNLRGIYLQQRQYRKALAVVEMNLAITPDSADDLKHRGLIHYRLRNHRRSREDLESYLFLNSNADDAGDIKEILTEMKKLSALRN
jgi:regulator of sirC expression with transglutaminase-like and TPR domain